MVKLQLLRPRLPRVNHQPSPLVNHQPSPLVSRQPSPLVNHQPIPLVNHQLNQQVNPLFPLVNPQGSHLSNPLQHPLNPLQHPLIPQQVALLVLRRVLPCWHWYHPWLCCHSGHCRVKEIENRHYYRSIWSRKIGSKGCHIAATVFIFLYIKFSKFSVW